MSSLDTYPLDPSGTSVNNLVQGEVCAVPNTGLRVFALRFGAFFATSLVLVDTANNQPLAKSQYYAAWRYNIPTSKYKKDICGLIVITDPAVSNTVKVNYQVVGGPYSVPETDVVAMLTRRLASARSPAWTDVLPHPPALTPADFTDDEFGFASLENAMNAVSGTIVNGRVSTYDAVLKYASDILGPYGTGIPTDAQGLMDAHVGDANAHPYYLKKSEVGNALLLAYAQVRRPKNVSPGDQTKTVTRNNVAFACNAYRALYGIPQKAMRIQIALARDFTNMVADVTLGAVQNYTHASALSANTRYFWRVSYQNTEGEWSPWSTATSFTTS